MLVLQLRLQKQLWAHEQQHECSGGRGAQVHRRWSASPRYLHAVSMRSPRLEMTSEQTISAEQSIGIGCGALPRRSGATLAPAASAAAARRVTSADEAPSRAMVLGGSLGDAADAVPLLRLRLGKGLA